MDWINNIRKSIGQPNSGGRYQPVGLESVANLKNRASSRVKTVVLSLLTVLVLLILYTVVSTINAFGL